MALTLPDVDSNKECGGAASSRKLVLPGSGLWFRLVHSYKHWLRIDRMRLAKPLKRNAELGFAISIIS
jgi:hypothetical protein